MEIRPISKTWDYLKKDTWDSWLVSLVLIIIVIRFLIFPALSIATQTPLPIVVVESCSMYHSQGLDKWWEENSFWYDENDVTKSEFSDFSLKNGLNKGDIVFVWGRGSYEKGDIIIFEANTRNPIIHRIMEEDPISTKGDNNPSQIAFEQNIDENKIIGKAVGKIPLIGWIKLIFFEFSKENSKKVLKCPQRPTANLKNTINLSN